MIRYAKELAPNASFLIHIPHTHTHTHTHTLIFKKHIKIDISTHHMTQQLRLT